MLCNKLRNESTTSRTSGALTVTSCVEEILSGTVAAWWSPSSRYICYATFNDTKVPLFRFPYYGPRSDLYGDIVEFAYPKVGATNMRLRQCYSGKRIALSPKIAASSQGFPQPLTLFCYILIIA